MSGLAATLPPNFELRPADLTPLVAELETCLDTLETDLHALLAIADAKLTAMRNADVRAIRQLTDHEEDALGAHREHETRRGAVVARLAQALLLTGDGPPRLEKLAAHLDEPARSRIAEKTGVLRALTEQLARKSSLAREVAQSLQSHLRAVFAAIAEATKETLAYDHGGQHASVTTQNWIDAVG